MLSFNEVCCDQLYFAAPAFSLSRVRVGVRVCVSCPRLALGFQGDMQSLYFAALHLRFVSCPRLFLGFQGDMC